MADNAFTRFTNRLMDVSKVSDDEVRRNQEMADLLLTQSSRPQPIGHWTQGLAQLANAMNAQIYRQRASKGETALKEQKARALGDVLSQFPQDQRSMLGGLAEYNPDIGNAVLGGAIGDRMKAPPPPEKPSRIGQRVVSIPGQQPFEAEVWSNIDQTTNLPNQFIVRDGNAVPLQSDWITTPVERSDVTTREVDEKKLNTDAVESYNSSLTLARTLGATAPEVAANPGSVGTRGAIGLGLGGAVSVLWGPDAGNQVSRWIADNDIEKLGAVKARMQAVRSQLIPILTGETSSRFSEPEREIASRAAGIIDKMESLPDFARGAPEVIGAMKELQVASFENAYEQAKRAPGVVNVPFDLNTDQGQLGILQVFAETGFSEEAAIRALERLERIQNSAY